MKKEEGKKGDGKKEGINKPKAKWFKPSLKAHLAYIMTALLILRCKGMIILAKNG